MTDTDTPVAARRTVISNPNIDDPNAGIIVAPGDPLPAGAGIISNTPNRVDAAANYDEADAADRAGSSARPATRVVDGPSAERQAELQEIQERVAEGTNAWQQESRMLGDAADAPAPPAEQDFDPAKATGKDLDTRYGSVEGYPKRDKVADRQKWAVAFEKDRAA